MCFRLERRADGSALLSVSRYPAGLMSFAGCNDNLRPL